MTKLERWRIHGHDYVDAAEHDAAIAARDRLIVSQDDMIDELRLALAAKRALRAELERPVRLERFDPGPASGTATVHRTDHP